jgi:DNA polymerase
MNNTSFDALSKKIISCKKCLLRSSCTQVIVGSGTEKSKILFIGEAPGKKEDEQGIPFVGASGKLLEEMLSSVQMKREDVFITNIVKCRPPKNRDPLAQEILQCTPWLVAQIETIDPLLIVTLGRYSMNFFLPGLKISSAHGKVHTAQPSFLQKPRTFFTLYHPAASLYNGGLRTALFADFKKIPKILHILDQKIDAQ